MRIMLGISACRWCCRLVVLSHLLYSVALSLAAVFFFHLLKVHAQLGGATPCAADIAIFPFVRQFAAVDPAWFDALPLPAVQAWLAGWLKHALFETAMTKTATTGQTGQVP